MTHKKSTYDTYYHEVDHAVVDNTTSETFAGLSSKGELVCHVI